MTAHYLRTPDGHLTLGMLQFLSWVAVDGAGGLSGAAKSLGINRRQVQRMAHDLLERQLVDLSSAKTGRCADFFITEAGHRARRSALAALFADMK